MLLQRIFRRNKPVNPARENYASARATIVRNQYKVYEAVKEIGIPCNGRMIAHHLSWDSCSVTNRLSELTKKGRIEVAYTKKGLDGKIRRYYRVARNG
jgi:hypothetical protein